MQDLHALVVEDDPDISSALVETLSGAGFRVTTALDGKQAVAKASEDPPDLVTLDLTLPHMDGIEVCRRIREISDCYIVIVSARSDEVDRLIGLEVGADDFVLKPFSPRELRARVAGRAVRLEQREAIAGLWREGGGIACAVAVEGDRRAHERALVRREGVGQRLHARAVAVEGALEQHGVLRVST